MIGYISITKAGNCSFTYRFQIPVKHTQGVEVFKSQDDLPKVKRCRPFKKESWDSSSADETRRARQKEPSVCVF